jgi:hypothetical protein
LPKTTGDIADFTLFQTRIQDMPVRGTARKTARSGPEAARVGHGNIEFDTELVVCRDFGFMSPIRRDILVTSAGPKSMGVSGGSGDAFIPDYFLAVTVPYCAVCAGNFLGDIG